MKGERHSSTISRTTWATAIVGSVGGEGTTVTGGAWKVGAAAVTRVSTEVGAEVTIFAGELVRKGDATGAWGDGYRDGYKGREMGSEDSGAIRIKEVREMSACSKVIFWTGKTRWAR